jgi:hypothetical protein
MEFEENFKNIFIKTIDNIENEKYKEMLKEWNSNLLKTVNNDSNQIVLNIVNAIRFIYQEKLNVNFIFNFRI